MQNVSRLLYPIIILYVLAIGGLLVAHAAGNITVTPAGNGTVIVNLPGNTTCNIQYRLAGDRYYINAGNHTGVVKLNLPYGKYVFNVTCSDGQNLETVIDNKPAYLSGQGLYVLIVTVAFIAVYVWRRSIVTFALSAVFVYYFISTYLVNFTAQTQFILLAGYMLLAILVLTTRK